MSVVKVMFVKHAKNLLRYVMDGRDANEPVEAFNCSPATVSQDFDLIAKLHHGRGEISAVHIVQSWNAEESKKVLPGEFNQMGQKLVEQKFPGHAFIVVTHSDTGLTHNHIVVSPWHSETGRKIENKKRHLYELRGINDTICKERGLSVIEGVAKDRRAKMPAKVQKMMQHNGRSWLLDLCQKADFGRAYATSYDEYSGILAAFGVTARVENKNITYFYPDKERGKRGSKLGRIYDKAGLEEKFKANDVKFQAIPGLKEQVYSALARQSLAKVNLVALPDTTYSQGYRNYRRSTPESRSPGAVRYPHQLDPNSSIIPVEELRRARNSNILSYCRDNKIPIMSTPSGRNLLKGREYVELYDFHWRNTKNRTQGTLLYAN